MRPPPGAFGVSSQDRHVRGAVRIGSFKVGVGRMLLQRRLCTPRTQSPRSWEERRQGLLESRLHQRTAKPNILVLSRGRQHPAPVDDPCGTSITRVVGLNVALTPRRATGSPVCQGRERYGPTSVPTSADLTRDGGAAEWEGPGNPRRRPGGDAHQDLLAAGAGLAPDRLLCALGDWLRFVPPTSQCRHGRRARALASPTAAPRTPVGSNRRCRQTARGRPSLQKPVAARSMLQEIVPGSDLPARLKSRLNLFRT